MRATDDVEFGDPGDPDSFTQEQTDWITAIIKLRRAKDKRNLYAVCKSLGIQWNDELPLYQPWIALIQRGQYIDGCMMLAYMVADILQKPLTNYAADRFRNFLETKVADPSLYEMVPPLISGYLNSSSSE